MRSKRNRLARAHKKTEQVTSFVYALGRLAVALAILAWKSTALIAAVTVLVSAIRASL